MIVALPTPPVRGGGSLSSGLTGSNCGILLPSVVMAMTGLVIDKDMGGKFIPVSMVIPADIPVTTATGGGGGGGVG